MKLIFKYNGNAKYWTKNLKGEYIGSKFSLLHIYLDIFNNNHIVAKSDPTAVGYDECLLDDICNSHGKYKPELNVSMNQIKELNLSVSATFCIFLSYECTWYFLAKS